MHEFVAEVRQVTKQFEPDRTVLENVSFVVRRGEVVAITGPSGCGKTTLLRMVGGFDSPSLGEVVRPGRVTMVFQDIRVFPWLTIADHFRLAACPDAKSGRLAEMLHIDRWWTQPAWQLSHGTQKRLLIALALSRTPELLLLDEAFASVDVPTKLRIEAVVRDYVRSTQGAVVTVTHDLSEIARLAGRAIVLGSSPATVVGEFRADNTTCILNCIRESREESACRL